MNFLSAESLFQASFNVFTLSFLVLWVLALSECRKESGGKSLMFFALILTGLILQLGQPLYNIQHALRYEGMGRVEVVVQNLWLMDWYILVASFLLFIGFILFFARNGIKRHYKTCLPVAVAILFCFLYTTTLLVTGFDQ